MSENTEVINVDYMPTSNPSVNSYTLAKEVSDSGISTHNSATDAHDDKFNLKADKSTIPTKISALINDSHFAIDTNYVHTDNNFTTTLKTKLENQSGSNTGDETKSTIISKLGCTPVSNLLEARHYVGTTSEPAFQNNWVNYDGTNYTKCAFWKDNFGVVYIEGTIKSGTLNSSVFILPVGYRPSVIVQAIAFAWDGTSRVLGQVNIGTDGTVQAYSTANIWYVIKASFRP